MFRELLPGTVKKKWRALEWALSSIVSGGLQGENLAVFSVKEERFSFLVALVNHLARSIARHCVPPALFAATSRESLNPKAYSIG